MLDQKALRALTLAPERAVELLTEVLAVARIREVLQLLLQTRRVWLEPLAISQPVHLIKLLAIRELLKLAGDVQKHRYLRIRLLRIL